MSGQLSMDVGQGQREHALAQAHAEHAQVCVLTREWDDVGDPTVGQEMMEAVARRGRWEREAERYGATVRDLPRGWPNTQPLEPPAA